MDGYPIAARVGATGATRQTPRSPPAGAGPSGDSADSILIASHAEPAPLLRTPTPKGKSKSPDLLARGCPPGRPSAHSLRQRLPDLNWAFRTPNCRVAIQVPEDKRHVIEVVPHTVV